MVVLAPFYAEVPARNRYRNGPARAVRPRGVDGRRTRRRSACLGEAGSTLPGAQGKSIARHDLRNRDIGALGKHRMVFQERSEAGEVVRPYVTFDPESDVRVA